MAFTPVTERYTVEGGKIIHRVLLQDENGRTTQTEEDVGAAPPGAGEGQDIYNSEQPSLTGNDVPGGVSNPMAGADTGPARMAPLQNDYGAQWAGTGALPYTWGDISSGVAPRKSTYAFGDISAGQGPRGGNMPPDNLQNMPSVTNAFMPTAAPGQAMPGGAPAAPAAGAAGAAPGGGTGQLTADDWARAGGLARFSPDNPEMAMVQAMLDKGMQPFNKLNPFTQMLQRAATGLAAAFMIQNATNGQNVTTQGGQAPDTGAMFKDFITNSLGQGNVFSTLGNAAGQLPSAIQAYRQFQQGGGPSNAQSINPFLMALGDMLSSQGFAGTTGMLASLMGPSMPRSLASGYAQGLEGALANATRNFWTQPAPTGGAQGNDFMKYLMGV